MERLSDTLAPPSDACPPPLVCARSGSDDGCVIVWDAKTGQQLHQCFALGEAGVVWRLEFNATRLVAAVRGGAIPSELDRLAVEAAVRAAEQAAGARMAPANPEGEEILDYTSRLIVLDFAAPLGLGACSFPAHDLDGQTAMDVEPDEADEGDDGAADGSSCGSRFMLSSAV